MTTHVLDALAHLQATLETLSVALTAGDTDALLSSEESLAVAVNVLAAYLHAGAVRDPDLSRAVAGVRTELVRCRVLGDSADAFFHAVYRQPSYSRRGLHRTDTLAPRRVASVS